MKRMSKSKSKKLYVSGLSRFQNAYWENIIQSTFENADWEKIICAHANQDLWMVLNDFDVSNVN